MNIIMQIMHDHTTNFANRDSCQIYCSCAIYCNLHGVSVQHEKRVYCMITGNLVIVYLHQWNVTKIFVHV